MRFISQFQGYKVTAIKEDYELLASGQYRQIAPGFICEFKVGDTTDWERDLARKTFKFRGVPHDESGVRDIDPVAARVSSFDTLNVPESIRDTVEKALIASAGPERHILAEKPRIAAPWPNYDALHPAKIAAKVKEDGFDPQAVAAYERENKNRPTVLEALEALEADEELVSA